MNEENGLAAAISPLRVRLDVINDPSLVPELVQKSVGKESKKGYGVKELAAALVDTGKLLFAKKLNHELPPDFDFKVVPAIGFAAMRMVWGSELSVSTNSTERLMQARAFSDAMVLSTAVNDLADVALNAMVHNAGEGQSQLIEHTVFDVAERTKVYIEQLRKNPSITNQQKIAVAASLDDILALEIAVITRPDPLTMVEMEQYQIIVDGINVLMCAKLLLGEKRFPDRLPQTFDLSRNMFDPGNFDKLVSKYKWMVDKKPENLDEEKFLAVLYSTLSADIVDDYVGQKYDKKTGVQTYYSAAVLECKGDSVAAKKITDQKVHDYLAYAEELGLSVLIGKALEITCSDMASLLKFGYETVMAIGEDALTGKYGALVKNFVVSFSNSAGLNQRENAFISIRRSP